MNCVSGACFLSVPVYFWLSLFASFACSFYNIYVHPHVWCTKDMLTFCTQRVGRDREEEKNLCGFDGSVSTFLKETWPASQSLCAPFLWVLCLLQGWRICFSCFTERCLSACALQQCGRDSSVEVLSSVKPREIRATMSLLFPVRTATANLKKAIEIWLA